jgi:predicted acetyltransferase
MLDRPTSWWHDRTLKQDDAIVYRYLVRRDGEVRGYVVFTPYPEVGHLADIVVPGDETDMALATRDFVWLEIDAARALLGFAAAHWSIGTDLIWTGPADEPLAVLFPDRPPRADSAWRWMSRLVDVPAAIESRGYDVHRAATFQLSVTDDVLKDNDGSYRVELAEGTATVERIPNATAQTTVQGLAAMYSGWLHPAEAVRLGLLHNADAATITGIATAFCDQRPWMLDFF